MVGLCIDGTFSAQPLQDLPHLNPAEGHMGPAPADVQCMRYMLTVVGMGTGGLVELVVLLIS